MGKTMNDEKTTEARKKNIVSILMKIRNEERLKMIEAFLLLTLKREQQENKKD